jgi:ribonucleoside-diphosphate reductase alpha chain
MIINPTYYLRTLGASNIEKATVGVKKEMRGAVSEGASGGQNSGDAGGSHSATVPVGSQLAGAPAKRPTPPRGKRVCSIEAMKNGEECEACQ